jgi:predicted peptidase
MEFLVGTGVDREFRLPGPRVQIWLAGTSIAFSDITGVLYPAIAPRAASDPFPAVAERVSKVPIWIFHGEKDPRVPVEESRRVAAALKAFGSDVRYTELVGVGHNACDAAYDRADLFEWLFMQRRK